MPTRRHLTHSREAMRLLGVEIQARRKERRWTEAQLAERAGISRTTLRKVEAGDSSVAVGIVFDLATLVGVALFHETAAQVARERGGVERYLVLMPKRIRVRATEFFDDF